MIRIIPSRHEQQSTLPCEAMSGFLAFFKTALDDAGWAAPGEGAPPGGSDDPWQDHQQ